MSSSGQESVHCFDLEQPARYDAAFLGSLQLVITHLLQETNVPLERLFEMLTISRCSARQGLGSLLRGANLQGQVCQDIYVCEHFAPLMPQMMSCTCNFDGLHSYWAWLSSFKMHVVP